MSVLHRKAADAVKPYRIPLRPDSVSQRRMETREKIGADRVSDDSPRPVGASRFSTHTVELSIILRWL